MLWQSSYYVSCKRRRRQTSIMGLAQTRQALIRFKLAGVINRNSAGGNYCAEQCYGNVTDEKSRPEVRETWSTHIIGG